MTELGCERENTTFAELYKKNRLKMFSNTLVVRFFIRDFPMLGPNDCRTDRTPIAISLKKESLIATLNKTKIGFLKSLNSTTGYKKIAINQQGRNRISRITVLSGSRTK